MRHIRRDSISHARKRHREIAIAGNANLLSFASGCQNVNNQEWTSFVRKRKMLDHAKARLETLEEEWEDRCQSIFDRILAGADIEDGGRITEPGVRSSPKSLPPVIFLKKYARPINPVSPLPGASGVTTSGSAVRRAGIGSAGPR